MTNSNRWNGELNLETLDTVAGGTPFYGMECSLNQNNRFGGIVSSLNRIPFFGGILGTIATGFARFYCQ